MSPVRIVRRYAAAGIVTRTRGVRIFSGTARIIGVVRVFSGTGIILTAAGIIVRIGRIGAGSFPARFAGAGIGRIVGIPAGAGIIRIRAAARVVGISAGTAGIASRIFGRGYTTPPPTDLLRTGNPAYMPRTP